jgi:serine protease Do
MKKLLIILLLIILSGCQVQTKEFEVMNEEVEIVNLGETIALQDNIVWKSQNEQIIKINDNVATAVSQGITDIYNSTNNEKITVYVTAKVKDIYIIGDNNLQLNETTYLSANVVPSIISQEVLWESNDPTVVSINANGMVRAVGEGLATIVATSNVDKSFSKEFSIKVKNGTSLIQIDDLLQNKLIQNTLKISESKGLFKPLIDAASASVIGVSNYLESINGLTLSGIGSGVIYKRQTILYDGTTTDELLLKNVKSFKYYVITNRHVIAEADVLKIYYQDNKAEIEAKLIQYDDKEDLAVLTFETPLYFPVAKLGDSNQIRTGELILAIGHSQGYEYFNSTTMGIISFTNRYMSSDTNNDTLNDWDAQYIQHDAPINGGNSGGPIINLKGEVIGINTVKLSALNVDNLGFSIPINLVKEIVQLLEQGKRPVRAVLKVTVVDVKYIVNYPGTYPEYKIPENLDYGFYIKDVEVGGIAYAAGLLPGDIVIKFNHVEMRYSYILRAEISKFLIGSGDIVEMEIYRDNKIMKINVVY